MRIAARVLLFAAWAVYAAKPNQAPTVSLTSPANGATYAAPATISLSAIASDADGTIAKVEFFQGTTRIGTAVAVPYGVSWPNVPAGSYALMAKATDNGGAVSTSAAVNVTVAAPNLPPLVVLTAPDACLVYDAPASIVLTADAVDPDGSVVRVDFLQGATVIGSSAVSPYAATWTNVAPGTYTIVARATDQRGGVAASTPVTLVVRPANRLPAVALTAPADGAVFNAPTSIALAATATDADGTIAKVEFIVDGRAIGTATTAPYQFAWATPPAGVHQLSARATDNAGGVVSSPVSQITVNAPVPSVTLTSPVAGAQFGAPATIGLAAEASVAYGAIAKVEFIANGNVVASATASPYAAIWSNVPAGTYVLTARTTTVAGVAATSNAASVAVNAIDLTLDGPADNAILYQGDVVVSGGFSGVTVSSVTVNGIAAGLGSRTFAAVAPLALGANLLDVVAETSRGRVNRTLRVTRAQPSVTLTNVTDGQTIGDDTVTLIGTASLPPNSAVAVNGQLATLAADGRFFVNGVPLSEGQNALAIVINSWDPATPRPGTASRPGEASRRKSAQELTLNLNRSGTAPFVLRLDKTAGLAPLTVDVLLQNRLAYAYDKLELDTDGNGVVDYAEPGYGMPIPEREFLVTYDTPGVYPLTIRLTRQNGSEIVYQAVRMVQVQAAEEVADTLRSIFIGMLQRLSAGDATGASQWLTDTVRARYQGAFNRLAAILPIVVEGIGTIESATFSDTFAELSVLRQTANGADHYSVLLLRDGDGLWRIDGM